MHYLYTVNAKWANQKSFSNMTFRMASTGIPRYSALHLALFRYSALAQIQGSAVLRC
jgi:hypothetical protein